VWLPFDVNGGPAQIVEGGLIAAVGGGDECGVISTAGAVAW
jgi:hypothetical protein